MNKSVKSVVIISLGLLAAPLALSAKTHEEAYIESYRGRSDIPAPVAVVSPAVSTEFAGQVVELEFVVDATGKPGKIDARTPADAELVEAITYAVKRWKFSPARTAEGEPVARKVILPVRIVDLDARTVAMK